ncbi:MAG: hypothetical protein IIA17_07910 [candidate division Zixibacteria bacterium]|nr:hypothetical protein [candidate division Zixibacteria bacterium]
METSLFKQLNNIIKLLTAGIAAAIICGCLIVQSIAAEPPLYQGYSLAVPKISQTPPTDISMPILRKETFFNVIVSVTENGETKSLNFSQDLSPQVEEYLSSILSRIEYQPAAYLGSKRSCQLPLIIIANPRFRRSEVVFPVSSNFEVSDNFLYYEALWLNKFELPEILSFPRYYCDLKRSDSLEILPYVLEKLSLDSAGKVLKSENFSASFKAKAFSSQIRSASLWSEFSPLKIEGISRPSDCYLLVSFLPQLHYPIKKITALERDTSHWAEKWRVRLLPDTVGLMVPPLPLELNIGSITLKKQKQRYLTGEILATILIDSLGKARVMSTDRKDAKYHQAINSALSSVGFFPAMSFRGKPQEFIGKARFQFTISARVRVDYLWLDF